MDSFWQSQALVQWLDKDNVPKLDPKPNIHQKKLMEFVRRSSTGMICYIFMKTDLSITADVYCNQMNVIMKVPALKQWCWRTEKGQFSCKRMLNLMLHEQCCSNYNAALSPTIFADFAPSDYHFFRASSMQERTFFNTMRELPSMTSSPISL